MMKLHSIAATLAEVPTLARLARVVRANVL